MKARAAIAVLRTSINAAFSQFKIMYEGGDVCGNFQIQSTALAARSLEAAIRAQIAFENGK